jgi:hypothetical protein
MKRMRQHPTVRIIAWLRNIHEDTKNTKLFLFLF